MAKPVTDKAVHHTLEPLLRRYGSVVLARAIAAYAPRKDHVVLTQVHPMIVGNRIMTHVYGPHTQGYARRLRVAFLQEASFNGEKMEASVHKLLDLGNEE